MNAKLLSAFDGKTVRIDTLFGETFDGECEFHSADYCEHEFGKNLPALAIDNWLFFADQIAAVNEIETPELWMSAPCRRMTLAPEPFRRIEDGQKCVELRLWDEKRRCLRQGDVIRFVRTDDDTEVLFVRVEELSVFPGFDALYRALPLADCGYAPDELAAASPADMYRYYTPEQERKWGAVGIRFALL